MAELCLTCSLCCTHGLFNRVPIRADEIVRLQGRHLPVVKHGDAWAVPFPCPAHRGTCSIYRDRPRACAEYECNVLVALNRAEMNEADARRLLARANALAASLRAKIPGNGDFWGDVAGYCQDSPAWRRAHVDVLLDLAELRLLLRQVDPKSGMADRDETGSDGPD